MFVIRMIKIKEDEMGGTCSIHREMRNAYTMWLESLKGPASLKIPASVVPANPSLNQSRPSVKTTIPLVQAHPQL
jgi:hypothetical protein